MGIRFRRRSNPDNPAEHATAASVTISAQPDQAWRVLSVTNEWIRHADAKAGVTLAFAGATATILSRLVDRHTVWTGALTVVVFVTALFILGASISSAFALVPRVKRQGDGDRDERESRTFTAHVSGNLLFFEDVCRNYYHSSSGYRRDFSTLTANSSDLTGQIADQVHANSCVAAVKFRWANRAIGFELLGALALAATALLVAAGW